MIAFARCCATKVELDVRHILSASRLEPCNIAESHRQASHLTSLLASPIQVSSERPLCGNVTSVSYTESLINEPTIIEN